jgi:glycosyltransferase involved in cell wall biosynthesis
MTVALRIGGAAEIPQSIGLGELKGCLDEVGRDQISGWAQDSLDSERRVSLVVTINGDVVGRTLANRHRPDLAAAGFGSGWHGFRINIPGGLSPHKTYLIGIARETDGQELEGSPVLLEALGEVDPALNGRLANALRTAITDSGEAELLDLLVARTDELLQRRADREIQRTARTALHAFRERWGDHLALRPGLARPPTVPARRALVVDDIVPDPARDAGSSAILSHMQALAALGYEVSLAASQEMTGNTAGYARIESLGFRSWCAPFYSSVEDVIRRQNSSFDVVYLHRMSNAAQYTALVRRYLPQARLIYSVADLHHVRLARQAEVEDRDDLRSYSNQVKLNEMLLAWSADAVITHSGPEAVLLKSQVPMAHIHVVPWAVSARPGPVGTKRQGVVFIGNYNHHPNVDAAQWLADTIMPVVHQTDPDIGCILAGSAMPETVRSLDGNHVSAAGYVPDLGPLLAKARVTIAPLRYGAGIKGKVLDSFAHGVPCIMTKLAAEGINLPPVLQGLVADEAADIARLIVHLHQNDAAYLAAREAGLAMVREHYNPDVVAQALGIAVDIRPITPS